MSSVIFGVRLDELASVEQLRGVATGFLDGDRAFRIFTPNPEILLHAREDTGYADVLRSADLALPGLKVVTAGAGATIGEDGLAHPADREDEIVEAIRSAAPTIVLVGLGAPKQERWIERHADAFPSVRIMIGVGGAFDMWGGSKRRAPRAFRTLGLEWLWRLALEPRRLPRILRATVVFPVLALFDRTA